MVERVWEVWEVWGVWEEITKHIYLHHYYAGLPHGGQDARTTKTLSLIQFAVFGISRVKHERGCQIGKIP